MWHDVYRGVLIASCCFIPQEYVGRGVVIVECGNIFSPTFYSYVLLVDGDTSGIRWYGCHRCILIIGRSADGVDGFVWLEETYD